MAEAIAVEVEGGATLECKMGDLKEAAKKVFDIWLRCDGCQQGAFTDLGELVDKLAKNAKIYQIVEGQCRDVDLSKEQLAAVKTTASQLEIQGMTFTVSGKKWKAPDNSIVTNKNEIPADQQCRIQRLISDHQWSGVTVKVTEEGMTTYNPQCQFPVTEFRLDWQGKLPTKGGKKVTVKAATQIANAILSELPDSDKMYVRCAGSAGSESIPLQTVIQNASNYVWKKGHSLEDFCKTLEGKAEPTPGKMLKPKPRQSRRNANGPLSGRAPRLQSTMISISAPVNTRNPMQPFAEAVKPLQPVHHANLPDAIDQCFNNDDDEKTRQDLKDGLKLPDGQSLSISDFKTAMGMPEEVNMLDTFFPDVKLPFLKTIVTKRLQTLLLYLTEGRTTTAWPNQNPGMQQNQAFWGLPLAGPDLGPALQVQLNNQSGSSDDDLHNVGMADYAMGLHANDHEGQPGALALPVVDKAAEAKKAEEAAAAAKEAAAAAKEAAAAAKEAEEAAAAKR